VRSTRPKVSVHQPMQRTRVVSVEQLILHVWKGVIVGEDSPTRTRSSRALGSFSVVDGGCRAGVVIFIAFAVIQREPTRPVPPNSVAVLPFEPPASLIERRVKGNSCNCHEGPNLADERRSSRCWNNDFSRLRDSILRLTVFRCYSVAPVLRQAK
jgi:hypothetical protein